VHDKLLLTVALLIPLVLGAGAFWTLAGSADPIRVPSAAPAVSLALTRPVSGVQAPPTLAPQSGTPTPGAGTPAPARTGSVAQTPAQPTVAPKPTTPVRADAARSTDRGKPKGKRRD
jgi:hypothetical protein